MQPPIIGITTYGQNKDGRFDLPVEYVTAVRRAGGLPFLVAPGEPHLLRLLDLIDGLLLAGGGDMHPGSYGGAMHDSLDRVDVQRDETELALSRAALASGLPCLGVCRGAQVLNVAMGGTLVVHLPDETDGTVAHTGATSQPVPHPIELEPGCRLAEIMGVHRTEPLSKHHQGIGSPGRGLVVTGRAPDGVIEAFEVPDHPWLMAVQWHPELTASDDPAQQRLFDAFVEAATTRSAGRRRGAPERASRPTPLPTPPPENRP